MTLAQPACTKSWEHQREGGCLLDCGLRVHISFCSCLTLPDQQKLRLKSPVLKKQACPQWKHSFVFNGVSSSQLRQSSLELTVWDQAIFGMNDRLLGGARLGSSKYLLGESMSSRAYQTVKPTVLSLVTVLHGYQEMLPQWKRFKWL